MRLAADRGRVEQQFRPHQHHRARGFGIPLVPAHADAQRPAGRGLRRRPHLEPGIAGAEVELLLVTGTVGNVALAIDALDFAIGADHREAVVIMRPVRLEEAGRDRHLQRLGQRLHGEHRLMLADGGGVGEQALVLDAAEIFALEQFRRQDHARALPAASRTRRDTLAMFASMSFEKASCSADDGDLGHRAPVMAPARPTSPLAGRPSPNV